MTSVKARQMLSMRSADARTAVPGAPPSGKHFQCLAHVHDPGKDRNLLSFAVLRITRSAPVLVQAANGFGAGLVQPDLARDFRTPFAARPNHFRIVSILFESQRYCLYQPPR